MLVSPQYQSKYNLYSQLENEEFLIHYIWYLEHLFSNELALLKNCNREFIAITDLMAKEFNLGSNILGKTFDTVEDIPIEVRQEIKSQEIKLLSEQTPQVSLYFYKKDNLIKNYLVRKRPLVNPHTKEAVGILVNTEAVIPNIHRKFIMSQFLGLSKQVLSYYKPNLPAIQQQILFCLLVGINSRKEIAETLTNITGNTVTENQVKNSLQVLYNEFGCNNATQLVNLVLSDQIPFELPDSTIPPGNYLI